MRRGSFEFGEYSGGFESAHYDGPRASRGGLVDPGTLRMTLEDLAEGFGLLRHCKDRLIVVWEDGEEFSSDAFVSHASLSGIIFTLSGKPDHHR